MVRRFSDDEYADLRAFYEEHGAVKLTGLLSPDEAAMLLAAADEMKARADEPIPPGADLSYGRADGRMTIRYLWRTLPQVRDFMLRRELAEPIARIVGTKELRFWFDLTFMHDGAPDGDAGDGSRWHHDVAAFGFKGEHLPSLWMALTPADERRSRLRFIDGSHRSAPGLYRLTDAPGPIEGEPDGFVDLPDFSRLIDDGEVKELTWDCEPGDAIIIHPYQIHGAKGNRGESDAGRRVAITTRWLGDDIRFLPHNFAASRRMPGMAASDLRLGSRPSGEYFPLVWSEDAAA